MVQIYDDVTINVTGPTQWVMMDGAPEAAGVAQRCTVENLSRAIAAVPGAEVVSASVNRSGVFDPPALDFDMPPALVFPTLPISSLPAFCDVRVNLTGPGNHVAQIIVWAPLAWNGRFMGVVGGGNRTSAPWVDMPFIRSNSLPVGIRNGFAVATTDAANRDRRFADWGLSADGELDLELVRNWVDRSTHDMTLVGKAITEALYGAPPRYSYLAGCSGGGRQGLALAQAYPEDYDGIWASDPGINWTRTIASFLWPAVLMNEHDNPLAPAKLDAFRAAAIAANDGRDSLQDGIIGAFEACDYDPGELVGTMTDAGEITTTDADIMRRIWEGPRRADGSFLWYGPRPCVRTSLPSITWCGTLEVDGKLIPLPPEWGPSWMRWVLGDPDFDWKTLTTERYIELVELGIEKFSWVDTSNTDLSRFRDHGAKLIISQAADDELVIYQSTVHYFRGVIDAMGGEEATSRFARLFVCDGDSHGNIMGVGPGLTLSAGMAALMNWVENDTPPEMIIAERADMATMEIVARRPVYRYPAATQYKGTGDPADANSYCSKVPEIENL